LVALLSFFLLERINRSYRIVVMDADSAHRSVLQELSELKG
jgi:hypothetical protein